MFKRFNCTLKNKRDNIADVVELMNFGLIFIMAIYYPTCEKVE